MARKRNTPQSSPDNNYRLTVTRDDAKSKLQAQIDKGNALLAECDSIASQAMYDESRDKYYTWKDFCRELLTRMFSNDTVRNSLDSSVGIIAFGGQTLSDDIEDHQRDIRYTVRKLESVRERLDIIDAPEDDEARSSTPNPIALDATKVFVVHGHDEAARETVARAIERLGLSAVILNEQVNEGKTIIEKFESHAAPGFAVVLLTPDDVGGQTEKSLQSRARQNVILELGFFMGKLGRNRVLALVKGKLEIPSDISGVVYENMDSNGGWMFRLGRELKAAGIDVDLNKLG